AAGRANDQVIRHVETALQAGSLDGSSAAQLDPERFAVLRDSSDTTDLADKVAEAALIEGVSLAAASTQVALTPETPAHLTLKALRYALEGCIRDGALERPELAFSDSLNRVMGEADRFRAMVRNREFDVHYQPIVDLDTGAAHHFEALARLKGQTSPAGSIRM
ncbi:MAG: EAL domain-containing protein, partial [Brevundimonas aurantiaca]